MNLITLNGRGSRMITNLNGIVQYDRRMGATTATKKELRAIIEKLETKKETKGLTASQQSILKKSKSQLGALVQRAQEKASKLLETAAANKKPLIIFGALTLGLTAFFIYKKRMKRK